MLYLKMLVNLLRITGLVVLLVFTVPEGAFGFGVLEGTCEGDCLKCHQITKEEVTEILREVNPQIEVMDVRISPVGGLWEVVIKARGKKGIAYVDFAKRHIISGPVIEIKTKENITSRRLYDINKVDILEIPLEDALIMGQPDAKYMVIVFDDPD